MGKSNTIFGHKNKEKWRPKAPEPKVLKMSTQSIINNTINQTIPKKKIDVIITSVNYNDFLILSLENNTKYFENITVVTSNDDKICQDICESFGVKCITTDVFYEDGFKFNKGKAINVGIESIINPEFILLLDADIIVTNKIELNDLENDTLYTSDRWICYNYFQYERWGKNEISVVNLPKYERDNGYGFFQLFNFNNTMESKWYPSELENSSHPDLKFSSLFSKKQTIDVDIIHLGDIKKNWDGRTSEKFITDNLFIEMYNNKSVLDKKDANVYELKTGISKYGKFKISDQISFQHHNGGWSYALETLNKVSRFTGVRLECFLDKNFCWINSNQEVIQEDWVGILHNPIEAPQWYLNQVRNKQILKSTSFIKSLENCKGLYVFSDYEKKILFEHINKFEQDIKIDVLRHPVSKSKTNWSIENFNSDKKIIHIGWWLRDIQSFYRLETNIRKIRIKLNDSIERKINKIFKLNSDSVIEIDNLDENEYEEILCNSVVFINLIDSVVNNTVLECIERNTPILINRNSSVEEYIGKDYPLFYEDISEIKSLMTESKLIEANLHLKKINLSRDLGRQVQQSEIYKSICSELNVTEILRPGDLQDSEGGIYNPGFFKYQNKNYMIVRVEKFTEKERGVDNLWLKSTSVAHIIEMDENFNKINSYELEVIGDFIRIEDFRLFTTNDKLYSNHIIIDKDKKIYPVISEVDIKNRKLIIKGRIEIGIEFKEVEKNWVFYNIKNQLYLIYSISPWMIFKIDIDNLTGELIKNEVINFDWNQRGFISNSTNPIRICENRNIMGFHSRDKKLIYHQGFLTFDDEFNFINSTKTPYLSGGDYDGIHPHVIYTSSMTLLDDKLICFAGDGDFKSIMIEINNEKIWKELL
jgi:predicted GH43/DUF377 family glycosyl hydrolase